MREITYAQAVREAMAEEMQRDENVILLGEDVGVMGGTFTASQGLLEEFGEHRVIDTPISEAAIVGCAIGAAMTGLRPIAEIMFADFTAVAMDQIVNQAAKARYMSGGKVTLPLVIRTTMGSGFSGAAQHSQSPHAWFMHVPGLKVVIPATPYDAKGLLKSAIRDDDPVMVFEHKLVYFRSGAVPEEEYTVPIGQAEVKRQGDDATIVATSSSVLKSLAAAEQLAEEGIEAEVVDVRSLVPLDVDTIVNSVRKTERLVIADEGVRRAGVAAEIAATVMYEAFDHLDAPIERVCAEDTPIPFSPPMEQFTMVTEEKIIEAVKRTLGTE